jgi:hypothetical protein
VKHAWQPTGKPEWRAEARCVTQAVLGGKANPTADDVKAILGSGAQHAVLAEEQQSPQSGIYVSLFV